MATSLKKKNNNNFERVLTSCPNFWGSAWSIKCFHISVSLASVSHLAYYRYIIYTPICMTSKESHTQHPEVYKIKKIF